MEFTAEAIRRAERVRLIIFDVDGVLTDGGIYIGPDGELCNVGVLHRRCLRNGRITGKLADRGLFRCELVQKSGTGGADGLKEPGGRGCDPLKEGWVGIGADRQLGQTDAQQGQQAPEDQPAPEMRL